MNTFDDIFIILILLVVFSLPFFIWFIYKVLFLKTHKNVNKQEPSILVSNKFERFYLLHKHFIYGLNIGFLLLFIIAFCPFLLHKLPSVYDLKSQEILNVLKMFFSRKSW